MFNFKPLVILLIIKLYARVIGYFKKIKFKVIFERRWKYFWQKRSLMFTLNFVSQTR